MLEKIRGTKDVEEEYQDILEKAELAALVKNPWTLLLFRKKYRCVINPTCPLARIRASVRARRGKVPFSERHMPVRLLKVICDAGRSWYVQRAAPSFSNGLVSIWHLYIVCALCVYDPAMSSPAFSS